jgi:NDP-sugar pyrophosphorylase family protein
MKKINVIIPMAGHSRRFYEAGYIGPKALLPVGNKVMIEHVINMFDPTFCKYHIIINKKQLDENSNLINELKNLALSVEVIVISAHEIGPVYSILQIKNINKEEEVIISYCDFFVEWDYQSFLKKAESSDGCIVSFKGFHPASFGNTYYAYMRVESERMLELKEKQSFTNNRFEEHASAGIYYFKNFELFEKYAKDYLLKDENFFPEAYVSLLYNKMVEDGMLISIHEADKFICLGTPDDYEQYQFWYNYSIKKDKPSTKQVHVKKRIGLIPMAGKGSRFREYGYRVAKPLIKVKGIPMVVRTVNSMPGQDKWIFLPREEDVAKYPIEKTLREFSADCVVHPVSGFTSGQAATCLLAKKFIDNDSELIISSADYEHVYNENFWLSLIGDSSIDGVIWTYRSRSMILKDPENFAYCQVLKDGVTVSKVVEKKTISSSPNTDPLVVGTFWYRKAKDFIDAAENLIKKDITINNEHYVGTSINYLIEKGKRFVIFDIDQWISFGDPFEVQVLEYWDEHFKG